jgi:hypothetical protein
LFSNEVKQGKKESFPICYSPLISYRDIIGISTGDQKMPKITVPREIQLIAKRAIEYNNSKTISQRASYKEENGKRVPGTGMRTARRLASGQVDKKQLELMKAWFARHGESPKEAEARRDKTSKAAVAWALWGGTPGRRWVNRALRTIEKKSQE